MPKDVKLSNHNDIELRLPDPGDDKSLSLLANNIKIFNNVRDYFPHPYQLEDARRFIAILRAANPPTTFGIYYRQQLAGIAGLVPQQDTLRHSCEVGYWIGEPFWGKGIASGAVQLLCQYAFEELKMIRLFASAFEHNIASQKVLEKNGFQLEGIGKKAIIKNGILLDEYRYGKLLS